MHEVFTFGTATGNSFALVGIRAYWVAWAAGLGLGSGVFAVLAAAVWLAVRPHYTLDKGSRSLPGRDRTGCGWSGTRKWEKEMTNRALLPGRIIWEPVVFRVRVGLLYSIKEKAREGDRIRQKHG